MRHAAAGCSALLALLCAAPATAGDLTGRITLAVEGTRLADLGPTVVFLAGAGLPRTRPGALGRRIMRQRNARFEPDFLVVSAGQEVEMPNDDTIFHNVFSFSRPNDFDLGVYPAGESRTLTFAAPGLVKLYCSIHESMSGAVLVTPSPWFANASPDGRYRIEGVPAGLFQLTVWNEKLPALTRSVEVRSAGTTADLVLGSTAR